MWEQEELFVLHSQILEQNSQSVRPSFQGKTAPLVLQFHEATAVTTHTIV